MVTNASVAVWHVPLAQPDDVVSAASGMLNADEAARAARFVFERDRRRFVLARAALRHILAGCLATDPAEVRFVYSAAGKPSLQPGSGVASPLAFNVSHSHEVALIAVTRDREVGVDVEYQREMPDMLDIAQRFFSPREAARLLALPAVEQKGAFFRCWTRKEAYLKARGDGIVGGLDRFDVSFELDELPRLLSTLDDPSEAGRWALIDLPQGQDYAGALAVTGPRPQVAVETWRFAA